MYRNWVPNFVKNALAIIVFEIIYFLVTLLIYEVYEQRKGCARRKCCAVLFFMKGTTTITNLLVINEKLEFLLSKRIVVCTIFNILSVYTYG